MVKIHFCHSTNLGSLIIQALTFSRWNHVGIEIKGRVFDATLFYGVQAWNPEEFKAKYKDVKTVEVDIPDEGAALDFSYQQVGKDYDWTALVALPFRSDWQDSAKWFCSELVAAVLVQGGQEAFKFKASRVIPRDLWFAL